VELEPYFAVCLEDKCAGCGLCINQCPYQALSLVEKEGRTVMQVTEAKCKGCGTCGGFCSWRCYLDAALCNPADHSTD